ncbi:hypothetical protein HZA86_03695 [Candidatus Uhrbacteria bacterium]|nr:hypothetical protein [Candidatus Uhrbacteria bacterium]
MVLQVISPLDSTERIFAAVTAVSVTAFGASLMVTFASFDRNERLHKWMVQYGVVPFFGIFGVMAYQYRSFAAAVIVVASAAVHFGYWLSSPQSRGYRLELFKFGFGDSRPATKRVIARLCGVGEPQIADEIIKAVLKSQTIAEEVCVRAQAVVGEVAIAALREEHASQK